MSHSQPNHVRIVSIDPGVEKCGVAMWAGTLPKPVLLGCGMVKTSDLVTQPGASIAPFSRSASAKLISAIYREEPKRILIIERPYVGTKVYVKKSGELKQATLSKTTVSLSMAVGQISGVLRYALGFEIVEAPTFGNDSWIAEFLGKGITSEQVKKFSIMVAHQITGEKHNEHISAAICIGQWWIDKQKFNPHPGGAA